MQVWLRAAILLISLLVPSQAVQAGDAERDRLAALANLYAHVRFFHPSDETQGIDWSRVMVRGVKSVRAADDPESLAQALDAVFAPIAPTLIVTTDQLPDQSPPADVPHTYWEHMGLWYGPGSNMYRSTRVGLSGAASYDIAVDPGEAVDIELGAGVRARVPLSLPIEGRRTLPSPSSDELNAWRTMIESVEIGDASDTDNRVASTLMTWAVLRHFFPYFDVIETDWDARLDVFIERALKDQTQAQYYRELCAIMAELDDGHGYVYMPSGLPWSPTAPAARFDRARDGSIVVTLAWNNSSLRHGDVIVSIDGRTAAEELARWESVTSGSDHLRRHRALNQFGTSDEGGPASVVVRRIEGGEERELTLSVQRTETAAVYFVQPEFYHPPVSEVAEGVWLINLRTITKDAWDERLDEIKQAKGLIVDFRWGGSGDPDINSLALISHFIDEPVSTTTWEVPGIVRPGLEEIEWVTSSWEVHPREPRLQAEVVFLNSPAIVSFGETVMAFWDHYGLAQMVGEPTAGCNGNINRIGDLPCGMVPNFTGMRVRKHDGSVLYGVGYEPDVRISRTVEQIRSGEDIALTEAIKLLTDE